MKFPFRKPNNYEDLDFQDKIKFIRNCYTERGRLYRKYNAKFFGGPSDFSILLLNSIDNCLRDYYNPQSYNYRSKPHNNHDLEAVYDIANQFFLSNDELFDYVTQRIKDNNLSKDFVAEIKNIVSNVKEDWQLFEKKVGFNDELSTQIRNKIKLGGVGCASASLLCCGFSFFSTLTTAVSAVAYSVSGELGDSLALATTGNRFFASSGQRGEPQYQYEVRMPGYLDMLSKRPCANNGV